MRVLGLDLSLTCTGAAVIDLDVLTGEAQVVDTQAIRADKLRGNERLVHIRDAVIEIAEAHRFPDLAALEGYSFGSISLAHSIGELGGVVKVALHQVGVPLQTLPPATWRKQLLGRGNLAKDEIKLEAFVRYGVRFDSTDVTEAFCIALAAARRSAGFDQPAQADRRRRREARG